jgi:uncharacterized protein
MHCKRFQILLVLVLAFTLPVFAQFEVAPGLVKKINKPAEKVKHRIKLSQSNNPLEGTAMVLFSGYKSFVSSQDMSNCVFHPSCSVYAMQSIQNDNVFDAYLKIFDRLTRCHPLIKQGHYPFNKKTGLYHDPIH